MSAAGRWFIGPHSVRRYIERVAPRLSYEDALERMISESERSHYVRTERDGCELWRGPKPARARFIVQPQATGLPVLRTVLAEFDGRRPWMSRG